MVWLRCVRKKTVGARISEAQKSKQQVDEPPSQLTHAPSQHLPHNHTHRPMISTKPSSTPAFFLLASSPSLLRLRQARTNRRSSHSSTLSLLPSLPTPRTHTQQPHSNHDVLPHRDPLHPRVRPPGHLGGRCPDRHLVRDLLPPLDRHEAAGAAGPQEEVPSPVGACHRWLLRDWTCHCGSVGAARLECVRGFD